MAHDLSCNVIQLNDAFMANCRYIGQTPMWAGQGIIVTLADRGKRDDTESTNHPPLRLFTALSVINCQQEFTAISNQRQAVRVLLNTDWHAGAAASK